MRLSDGFCPFMDIFAIVGLWFGVFATVSLGLMDAQPGTRTLELVYEAVALGFAVYVILYFQLKSRRASRDSCSPKS